MMAAIGASYPERPGAEIIDFKKGRISVILIQKTLKIGSLLFYPPKAVGEGVGVLVGVDVAMGLDVKGSVDVEEGIVVCVDVAVEVNVCVAVDVFVGVKVLVLG
jgi:hypothetical protein